MGYNIQFKCIDTEGYYVMIKLGNLISGRTPRRFDVSNPHTIENIGKWLIDNNSNFKINLNQEYKGNDSDLIFTCDVCNCGEFAYKWRKIQQGRGCPYCSGKRVNHINCISSKRPDLIKYFKYKEDSNKFTEHSNKKIELICPNCKTEKPMSICKLTDRGFSCQTCGDGVSIPEKFTRNVLKQLEVDFYPEKVFHWADDKRFDFYIPSLNMIIEINGIQHYEQMKQRELLSNIKENDLLKEKFSRDNGIDIYIIIDCRYSNPKWLEDNFIKELDPYFNLKNIDFNLAFEESANSLQCMTWDLWKKGTRNSKEISKILKMARGTIITWLNNGYNLNIVDYNSKEEMIKSNTLNARKKRKVVGKYSLDGSFIKRYESITEASRDNNISTGQISGVCSGKYKTAHGFNWKWL